MQASVAAAQKRYQKATKKAWAFFCQKTDQAMRKVKKFAQEGGIPPSAKALQRGKEAFERAQKAYRAMRLRALKRYSDETRDAHG